MECTKVNCPMQVGTKTDNCGKNCPWRITVKTCDLILRTAAIEAFDDERVERNYGDVSPESVIGVIKSIPAVDAIPVEWLRSQLKNNPNDIESAYDDICINELIDRWQKEEEAI